MRVQAGPRSLDLGPPTIAYLSASITLWIAATFQGVPLFRSASWIRWDSDFYLTIASRGYQLVPCTAPYPPHAWCGNAGWFPGYPGVLAPLFDLGLPQGATAVGVSWLFGFGLLVLLWNGFLRDLSGVTRYLALGFAAFGPGTIYTRAVFPLAMTVFFVLLCFWLLERRHPWWAGAAGAVAAASYPTAILLAPIVVLWAFLVDKERALSERVTCALISGATVAVGFVGALWVFWLQTGSWTAYFKTQAKYHHGLHEPLAELLPLIHAVLSGQRGLIELSNTQLPVLVGIEATVVSAMMLALLAEVVFRLAKRRASTLELMMGVFVLLFWLAPYFQLHVAYYRDDALLIPSALLVPKLPPSIGILLLAAAVPLLAFMAFGFFASILH